MLISFYLWLFLMSIIMLVTFFRVLVDVTRHSVGRKELTILVVVTIYFTPIIVISLYRMIALAMGSVK